MSVEVLIVLVVIALIAAGLYAGHRMERKRVEAVRQVALVMGFAYAEDDTAAPLPAAALGLPLMNRGHSRSAKNVLTGTLADQPAMALDYTYVTGSGKNRATHRQSVAVFLEGGRGLPDFELAPENVFHKIGQVFGYQDIDFGEDEEFSRRYLLRGKDEAGIRGALSGEARAFLTGNPGWSIQACAGAVALFRAGQRWKPEEVPARLADSLKILNGLSRR